MLGRETVADGEDAAGCVFGEAGGGGAVRGGVHEVVGAAVEVENCGWRNDFFHHGGVLVGVRSVRGGSGEGGVGAVARPFCGYFGEFGGCVEVTLGCAGEVVDGAEDGLAHVVVVGGDGEGDICDPDFAFDPWVAEGEVLRL